MDGPREPDRRNSIRDVGRPSRRAIALLTGGVLAVAGLVNIAGATLGSDGVVSACYNRRTGAVRLIREPRLPRRCPSGTRRFTFNVQGPEGSPGPTGPTGPAGPAGVPGPQGIAGTPGIPGDDGHTILHGAGAPPDSLGADGDFYLDDVAFYLYGPKTQGAWPAVGTSLIGADGADGTDGADGADGADGTDGTDGNTILSGAGAPGAGVGVNGDFYLDTTAWVLYGPKASGAWPGSGTSLVGPAGPGEDPVYIQVSDTTTQSIAVAGTFQDVTWSTTGVTEGFVHVPGTAQILVPRSGVYRITVSIPMKMTGLLPPTATATACLVVNGVSGVCQSAGFNASDLPGAVPLTSITSLVSGDVIRLRVKATSTSVQVSGGVDSTLVLTIASVD